MRLTQPPSLSRKRTKSSALTPISSHRASINAPADRHPPCLTSSGLPTGYLSSAPLGSATVCARPSSARRCARSSVPSSCRLASSILSWDGVLKAMMVGLRRMYRKLRATDLFCGLCGRGTREGRGWSDGGVAGDVEKCY